MTEKISLEYLRSNTLIKSVRDCGLAMIYSAAKDSKEKEPQSEIALKQILELLPLFPQSIKWAAGHLLAFAGLAKENEINSADMGYDPKEPD